MSDILFHAIINNDVLSVKKLIKDKNIDIESVDNVGRSALGFSCALKNKTIAKILIDAGADVNATDDKGITPLMVAVIVKDADMVKMLLEAGAKTDLKNNINKTALDIAEFNKQEEIISLLKGETSTANSNIKTNNPAEVRNRLRKYIRNKRSPK